MGSRVAVELSCRGEERGPSGILGKALNIGVEVINIIGRLFPHNLVRSGRVV